MGQSSRELNKAHWQGVPSSSTAAVAAPLSTGSPAPGSSGSSWRMSKLKRTYEVADEEGRPVEEVAEERYGSLGEWHDAIEERRILEERAGRGGGGGRSTPSRGGEDGGRKFVYTELASGDSRGGSRPPSRGSFRRPGEALERTNSTGSVGSRPSTPVPSVFTPPTSRTPRPVVPSALSHSIVLVPAPTTTAIAHPPLSQSELNRLQAKVLKARLMGNDEADALEKEYEMERVRTLEGGHSVGAVGGDERVKVLPTLDGRGRLYDVGTGKEAEEEVQPGKRKKKEKVRWLFPGRRRGADERGSGFRIARRQDG